MVTRRRADRVHLGSGRRRQVDGSGRAASIAAGRGPRSRAPADRLVSGRPSAVLHGAARKTPGIESRAKVRGYRYGLSALLVVMWVLSFAPESPSHRGVDFGLRDVFVSNADGSGRRNLTKNHLADDRPSLSPDGRTLAFERQATSLVLMSATSRNQRELLHLADRSVERPTWARDGRYIAFTSCVNAACNVGIVRRDGSDLTWIPGASDPTWTAGGQLAFLTDFAPGFREGPQSIGVSNRDGTGRRVVAKTSQVSAYKFLPPVASPSGRKLVFSAYDGSWSLYVLDLTRQDEPLPIADGYRPSWAPSGRQLVFENGSSIWIVGSGGLRLRPVPRIRSASFPRHPSWSPDGKRIAFVTHSKLVVVNLRARTLTRVARRVESRLPVWSPGGRRLYYVGERSS